MADTFSNDLRLRLQESGSNAGTWGDLLNGTITNIASALGQGSEAIPNASTHTITLADGTADEARSLYLKCTGGGQACTVTLGPNTISKVWIIDNATSYTLTFSQGSGANVAIAAGAVKVIATDGAGSGAAVVDTLDGLEGSLSTLTVTGTATATKLVSTNGVLELDDNGTHNGIINSPASLFINIDSDGTNTGELFVIAKDRTSTSGGSELLRVQEDGSVGIGTSSITNPYSQTPFTDVNIDGTWGGVISFKLGGVTKGWVGQRSSGNEDMVVGATANQDLLLYANNAEKMRVVTEGLRIGGGATAYTNTQFEIAAINGVDRHSRTISSGTNSRITGSGQSSILAEGVVAVDTVSAGTILTIPHFSQVNLWRPMMVELMFVTGEYNRTIGSTGGWAKFGYSVLNSVNGLATMGFGGNVAGVSASGMNILVTFGAGYTAGVANYEGVCMHYKVMSITPDYFQAWNATLN